MGKGEKDLGIITIVIKEKVRSYVNWKIFFRSIKDNKERSKR